MFLINLTSSSTSSISSSSSSNSMMSASSVGGFFLGTGMGTTGYGENKSSIKLVKKQRFVWLVAFRFHVKNIKIRKYLWFVGLSIFALWDDCNLIGYFKWSSWYRFLWLSISCSHRFILRHFSATTAKHEFPVNFQTFCRKGKVITCALSRHDFQTVYTVQMWLYIRCTCKRDVQV